MLSHTLVSVFIFSMINPAQSATSDDLSSFLGQDTTRRIMNYFVMILWWCFAAGKCGYSSFGATINNGYVAATSYFYRDGVRCGACYQVRCTNSKDCSDEGVNVVITDQGSSDRTDFIMTKNAFRKMAQSTYAITSLLSQGIVDNEYRGEAKDVRKRFSWKDYCMVG